MYSSESISAHEAADGIQELALCGELNVYHASRLHGELVRLADGGQDVRVCCEQLDAMDASVLQTLVAFRAALSSQGRALQLRGLSGEAMHSVRLAGLADLLGLTETSCKD